MLIERRKFERIECYMIARHTRRSNEEHDFFGTVRNISAGGAMIETGEQIPPGSILDLAFLIGEDRQIREGKGQVIWSRRKKGKNFLGLQFTEPLEEHWQNSLS